MFGRHQKYVQIQLWTTRSLLVAVSLLLSGCSEKSHEAVDPHVGKMQDFSYSGGRDKKYGPNALGDLVGIADFEGYFVWVDYAAPWCSPCSRQAPVIRSLESSLGDEVVFLTVMTSGEEPMQPATRETARRWAKRFKLEPSWVVAEGNSYRTIPQHALFSPLGQTLYRKVGFHSAAQVKTTLTRLTREWEEWDSQTSSRSSAPIY